LFEQKIPSGIGFLAKDGGCPLMLQTWVFPLETPAPTRGWGPSSFRRTKGGPLLPCLSTRGFSRHGLIFFRDGSMLFWGRGTGTTPFASGTSPGTKQDPAARSTFINLGATHRTGRFVTEGESDHLFPSSGLVLIPPTK